MQAIIASRPTFTDLPAPAECQVFKFKEIKSDLLFRTKVYFKIQTKPLQDKTTFSIIIQDSEKKQLLEIEAHANLEFRLKSKNRASFKDTKDQVY